MCMTAALSYLRSRGNRESLSESDCQSRSVPAINKERKGVRVRDKEKWRKGGRRRGEKEKKGGVK